MSLVPFRGGDSWSLLSLIDRLLTLVKKVDAMKLHQESNQVHQKFLETLENQLQSILTDVSLKLQKRLDLELKHSSSLVWHESPGEPLETPKNSYWVSKMMDALQTTS